MSTTSPKCEVNDIFFFTLFYKFSEKNSFFRLSRFTTKHSMNGKKKTLTPRHNKKH